MEHTLRGPCLIRAEWPGRGRFLLFSSSSWANVSHLAPNTFHLFSSPFGSPSQALIMTDQETILLMQDIYEMFAVDELFTKEKAFWLFPVVFNDARHQLGLPAFPRPLFLPQLRPSPCPGAPSRRPGPLLRLPARILPGKPPLGSYQANLVSRLQQRSRAKLQGARMQVKEVSFSLEGVLVKTVIQVFGPPAAEGGALVWSWASPPFSLENNQSRGGHWIK